jgi:hypothetical protein
MAREPGPTDTAIGTVPTRNEINATSVQRIKTGALRQAGALSLTYSVVHMCRTLKTPPSTNPELITKICIGKATV